MSNLLFVAVFCLCLILPVLSSALDVSMPLMKAKTVDSLTNLALYSVSEKYDGVRAIWRNGRLMTRSGRDISAPSWFIDALPNDSIEGELWMGYQRFDDVSALVRSQSSNDERWKEVQFRLFDQPDSLLLYAERIEALEQLVASKSLPWFQVVERFHVLDQGALTDLLDSVVTQGGEGLMLNRVDALYQPFRTDAILKMKPKQDAEAQVVGYSPGKGKYVGLMGSLIVLGKDGREFKIGSGFTDAERAEPPKIGSWVTFQYSGRTSSGLPKFPRYLREFDQWQ